MTCFHPAKIFKFSDDSSIITKFSNDYAIHPTTGLYSSLYSTIPCGRCIGCRLDYSREWASRLMMELQYHQSAYFVTLTYDNKHLPVAEFINEDGLYETWKGGTLVKRDIQLFLKSLRDKLDYPIRYYACGEYGSTTFRAHYHLIIFGLDLPMEDKFSLQKNFRGDITFRSHLIEKCWKKGHSLVGDVTYDSCSYVARYMMKKLKGNSSELYDKFGLTPPFTLCSNKPGIAYQYYLDHKDEIYLHDKIVMSTDKGGKTFKPPRYFDKFYELENPTHMQEIRINRENKVRNIIDAKLAQTDLDYLEYLKIEEANLLAKLGAIIERSNLDVQEKNAKK